jgi:hypothetical protein
MIGLCNSSPNGTTRVAIYDARPLLNARANMVKGGGYEDCGPGKSYTNCVINFGDIDNIHTVRASTEKLYEIGFNRPVRGKPISTVWYTSID